MSGQLLRSTVNVSGMTLLSRLLGFVRDMVIARYFGAGAGADAFFVAFKIPNFLRRLFAEGAFSQAFVPVLSEYRSNKSHAEVQQLVGRVSGALGVVLLGVTALAIVAAPVLVTIFAPGFLQYEDKFALTVSMLRITFPYLLFISLTALAAGILNSYGRFAIPAVTPVLLNICLIVATVWMAPHMAQPVVALAWGVFIAGIAQLVLQIPSLLKLNLLPRPRLVRNDEGVRRIGRLMLPAIFGSSVAQINLLFDTLIASFLVTGSVSWLYYSDRLVEFPLGVFGIALATVILPSLSRHHARAAQQNFADVLDWALRWVLVIGLPATLGLLVLAGPMLATLFQYGEFSEHDVRMASRSLMAYAAGLLPFILVKVLATGFYSRQDTRTPVRIAVVAMISNMVLNVMLVFPLAHAGLALATSIASYVNAGLLYRGLRRQQVYRPRPGWRPLALRVIVANAVMVAVLMLGVGEIGSWFELDWIERAIRLASLLVLGAASYFTVWWLLGGRLQDLAKAADENVS